MTHTTRAMRWAALILAVVPLVVFWPILITLGDLGCRGIDCPAVHEVEPWRWVVILAAPAFAIVLFKLALARERKVAGPPIEPQQ